MKDTELLRENKGYLIEEYTNGVSLNKLSKEFSVNSGTLWYVLSVDSTKDMISNITSEVSDYDYKFEQGQTL